MGLISPLKTTFSNADNFIFLSYVFVSKITLRIIMRGGGDGIAQR